MKAHLDCDYERVVCLYDEPKENPICFQVPIVSVSFLNNLVRYSGNVILYRNSVFHLAYQRLVRHH
jgi:hypothetical protein